MRKRVYNNLISKITLIIFIAVFIISNVNVNAFALNSKSNSKTLINSKYKEININEKKEIECENLKKINIKVIHPDVNIIPCDSDKINIEFKGKVYCASENIPKLITTIQDKSLLIEVKSSLVEIKNLNKDNINSLNIEFTSKLKLNIYIPKTYINILNVNTVSGDINVQSSKYIILEANTVSGNIIINNLNGDLKGKSVSGDIKINCKQLNNDIKIENVSGNVEIVLPQNCEFKYNLKSSSGKISNDFTKEKAKKGKINGTIRRGTKVINIKLVSGDINIKM